MRRCLAPYQILERSLIFEICLLTTMEQLMAPPRQERCPPPDGVYEADWLSWPAGARKFILAQQEQLAALRKDNAQLRAQLTALATELTHLRERIGRSSRNSS